MNMRGYFAKYHYRLVVRGVGKSCVNLPLAQLCTNSLPRGARSSYKCIQIVSGLRNTFARWKKIVRRIGGLSPTLVGSLFYASAYDVTLLCLIAWPSLLLIEAP